MKIAILSHPLFFGSFSMPRFAHYLASGMKGQGHDVEIWRPRPVLSKIPVTGIMKKWLGYIDQYVIFSIWLFFKTNFTTDKRLYIVSDQALGLWVPLIRNKAHLIHCHDFLALKSAKGQISDNKVGLTGKIYQKLILKGFSKGENFVSVSKNTQRELSDILHKNATINTYVYNGINALFQVGDTLKARKELGNQIGFSLDKGYILHVGGNQFYKNRKGVIKIYSKWRETSNLELPLVLIGTPPNTEVFRVQNESKFRSDIIFCPGLEDEMVKFAYQGASLFLFPSLAEGFGWPIAEAMACGCPVITTNEAPMNEVGGKAALYIKNTKEFDTIDAWARKASDEVELFFKKSPQEIDYIKQEGLENVKRFDSAKTISRLHEFYLEAYHLKYE
ncbi:glycosyltransferase [Pareuzebyella sediminis]|uniref:glycosyltransferase n=1 Tax=Pareuzebyella sediminis TaxID=2607998 RepID=UPI0011EEFE47|nr:glycosyltransferase [Pareuzebyella sediminis]